MVQADGTTKKQPIKTGLTNRVTTQVLSGLNEGDKVVIGEEGEKKSGSSSSKSKRPPMM